MAQLIAPLSVAQPVIHHAAALLAVHAAISKAEELNVRVSVAVVDSGGKLSGFSKMTGAFLVSPELAMKKARCAAGLGFSPDTADQVLAAEPPRVREGLLSHPDFILVRGGLPIHDDSAVIGAIGVSGATEAQDLLCAEAGIAVLVTKE